MDEYHSRHYGNCSVSSAPHASASRKQDHSRSCDFSRSQQKREREVRLRVEHHEVEPSAQRHEDRSTDETEVVNSGNVNPGVVNYDQGNHSWGKNLLKYQLLSENTFEELEIFVKNRGQSKDKVVPDQMLAKPAHVFAKKLYQIQTEFNNSVLKNLNDALEADTSEDHSTFLEEGIELIKQRNKLLVISDKYGWETGLACMLDPIAENSDNEWRIKKAWKEAKLLKEDKKQQQKSKRPSVQKAPFLGNRNPSFPSMLNGFCQRGLL